MFHPSPFCLLDGSSSLAKRRAVVMLQIMQKCASVYSQAKERKNKEDPHICLGMVPSSDGRSTLFSRDRKEGPIVFFPSEKITRKVTK